MAINLQLTERIRNHTLVFQIRSKTKSTAVLLKLNIHQRSSNKLSQQTNKTQILQKVKVQNGKLSTTVVLYIHQRSSNTLGPQLSEQTNKTNFRSPELHKVHNKLQRWSPESMTTKFDFNSSTNKSRRSIKSTRQIVKFGEN